MILKINFVKMKFKKTEIKLLWEIIMIMIVKNSKILIGMDGSGFILQMINFLNYQKKVFLMIKKIENYEEEEFYQGI